MWIADFENSIQTPKYDCIHDFFKDGFQLTPDDRFDKFDSSLSPWVYTFCDWFEDPDTTWIYLIFGSQLAKTSICMGAYLYASQYLLGAIPIFWCLNTEEMAHEFVKTRFKPFLEESGDDVIQRKLWKQDYFKVYNSSTKIGYATTKNAMASKAARIIVGDEICKWVETVDYLKMRTRTFEGKRKGIFASTPPEDENHHSVKCYKEGNFYQFYVPCLRCGATQSLKFANIQFEGRSKKTGDWNEQEVKESTFYRCEVCHGKMLENEKLEMIQHGTAKLVDCETFKPKDEVKSESKALQISSLYSVFTKWGTLAVSWLKANKKGFSSLKVFYTDELAEIFKQLGRTIKKDVLVKYVDQGRAKGFLPDYDAYTVGIDLQRWGDCYFTLLGFKKGSQITTHVLDFGKLTWKQKNEDGEFELDWEPIKEYFAPYIGNVHRVGLDSSDGVITQEVYDFCLAEGEPWTPIKDAGTQILKARWSRIDSNPFRHGGRYAKYAGMLLLSLRSDLVKDDLAACLGRNYKAREAWTFPRGTEDTEYFVHLNNEHRTTVARAGRRVGTWAKRYQSAPQHYFSSLVYAYACMEDIREDLLSQDEQLVDLNSYSVTKI